jgi:ABC-type transport system substrate-binding protein
VAGYSADLPAYPYDPAMARQLLTDAGYFKNPKPVIAWSFPQSSLAVSQKLLEGIVEYWKAVGVSVEIRATDGGAIVARVAADPQQFTSNDVMMVSASYRPSGINNLKVFATSKKAGGNQQDFATLAKIDGLALNAQAVFDPPKYEAAMANLWKSIVDDYWALPMAWVQNVYLTNPKVIGSWKPINHSGGYPAWHTLVPVGAK